jgi:tight adherence protein C
VTVGMLAAVPPTLVFLVLTLVLALVTIVYIALAEADRTSAMDRAATTRESTALVEGLLLQERPSVGARLAAWLAARLPGVQKADDTPVSEKLLLAGFDSPAAQSLFTAARVVWGIMVPLTGWLTAPSGGTVALVVIMMSVLIGLVGPTAVLDRLVDRRRERIRRGVPDALDLLVVCVEAGVSLDASMLRVSRDMATVHPELAFELGQVVRKVGAGMPRERALQQLPKRTGVEELRTLVASLIQSERLGSSIARVLRINAETLRLRRRQSIEKKAAEASLKMLLPLALFLLPALMIVIIGPAIIEMMSQFGG